MANVQQEALLTQIRAVIFSGTDFTKEIITQYSGKYKGFDISQMISIAKKQMEPASLPDIDFNKIVKLHQSRERIASLIDSHQEYLLNNFPEKENEHPFEWLSTSFEKKEKDIDRITKYIIYLEDRATKQQKNDTKDRLFEAVRDFAQWCKEFLLNSKYETLYHVLTEYYGRIVSKIGDVNSGGVSKVGINIFAYRDLAEECYALLREETNDEQGFQYILALINLRCKDLGVNVPVVNSMVVCPQCGDKEQTGNVCTKCHAWIKCPGCGATIVKGAQTCTGCGVEINKIDIYLSQIKDAGTKLSANKNYAAAEQAIEPVKTIWTKYEPLNLLLAQINSLKNQSIEYEKKLNVLLIERKYFTASVLLVEMKQKVYLPSQFQEKENEIRNAIDNAQKLFKDAVNLPVDNQIEACSLILSQVTDFQPVINNLKQIKLKIPTLSAELKGTTVLLNWQKLSIPTASVEYIITRKEKSSPTITDQLIYSGNNNSCNDNNILPCISYFYGLSIKVNIQGIEIQSISPSISPEILSVSDVSKYNITTGDKYIQLDFDSNASDYLLYRESEKGEKIQINDNLRTGKVIDRNVNNGVRYTYTLISIYKKLNGEIIKSSGLKLYATPQTPPKPITSLRFRKETGDVILSWDDEEKEASNIHILYSAIKIGKIAGTIIPLKDLKQAGTVLTTTMPNQAIVSLNNDHVKNFFSIWTAYGDNAMFGSEVEIINIVEVSNLKAYLSSGKLYVEWNWPANCNQVKVSYSNNSFEDTYKTVKNYPKELYDKQKAFVIDTIVNKDYFIEIQTQKFDNSQEIISSGARTILRNSNPMTIKYTLKVSTFLKKKLTLVVENDNNKCLPELALVSSPNRMPARKEDGSVIYVIPEGKSCGTFELPSEHIRKNYYARLFLSDISIKNIKIITPDKEHLKLY